MTTAIDITSDFICPWCWIGHHNLHAALKLAGQAASARIRYRPYELNPGMPAQGMERRQYRSAKFGSWERSQALDANVTQAGLLAGLTFNYDQVRYTPNTRLAHRLMLYAQSLGDDRESAALFEAIFAAYFSQGRDIGAAAELAAIAAEQGFDAQAVLAYLASDAGETEMAAALRKAQADGVNSVPSMRIGAVRVTGAQSADALAALLRHAPARVA